MALFILSTMLCACDPEPRGMTITLLTPQPAQHGKTLHIIGEELGEHVPDVSGVLISGTCAPIAAWTDERIDIVVPSGVGTGVRELLVVRDDGETARASVEISAAGVPPDTAAVDTRCRFRLPGPGGGTDTGGGDAGADGTDTAPDSRPDEIPPPDIPFVDFGTDGGPIDTGVSDAGLVCPNSIGPGACNNPSDCDLILRERERIDQASFGCTLNCLGLPDATDCIAECLSDQVELSNACSVCFGLLNTCLSQNCLTQCLGGPDSPRCRACRRANCSQEFEQCSGVRDVPGTPPP